MVRIIKDRRLFMNIHDELKESGELGGLDELIWTRDTANEIKSKIDDWFSKINGHIVKKEDAAKEVEKLKNDIWNRMQKINDPFFKDE